MTTRLKTNVNNRANNGKIASQSIIKNISIAGDLNIARAQLKNLTGPK